MMLGWLPRPGHAEGVGRIRGVIQREGKGFAEQRIMLIRFGPDQDVQRFPGQTDAEGRFAFDNLETGPAFTYFVGIRYQEQLHRSDPVILQDAEPVEVLLKVDASSAQEAQGSTAPAKLRIMNHLIVIVGRSAHLEVREVVRVVNTGSIPYIAQQDIAQQGHGGAAGISLHVPLPQGYSNMSQVQGLNAAHVHVDTAGLSYTAPLPPGEHQVVYTYNLPWHESLSTILVQRTLETAMLDVLIEDERLNATSDLQFGGPVSIDPHVFAHFRGVNLAAQSRSWVQLVPRQTSTSWLYMGAYSLIVGIMLLGMCMPWRDAWHSRARPEQATDALKHAPRQDVQDTGRQLLRRIARLDDEHENGTVDDATYQQHRQAYKEQLCMLVEQWQSTDVSHKAMDGRRAEV
ncbi:MAG TPA: hypothetical protein VI542_34145 [Candidatus Tectomicrobia bacterium]